MLPFTWRLHHENVLCHLYMMLPLYLFLCPLAEWQASFVWSDTTPSIHSLEKKISISDEILWRQSPKILFSIAQPLSSGNKQQRSWSHHHLEEDLFIVLVSRCWLTSFPGCGVCRQPLCPGKWSMHNCLTSQNHYHQLFLFADPLERG